MLFCAPPSGVRGGPHSSPRRESHGTGRGTPPRIVVGAPVLGFEDWRAAETLRFGPGAIIPYDSSWGAAVAHVAGLSTAPAGTSPLVTHRQSAIRSLRAKAMIIVLRTSPLAAALRWR